MRQLPGGAAAAGGHHHAGYFYSAGYVRANILLDQPDDNARLEEILTNTGLHLFIARLPQGLPATRIAEGALNLSLQAQRIQPSAPLPRPGHSSCSTRPPPPSTPNRRTCRAVHRRRLQGRTWSLPTASPPSAVSIASWSRDHGRGLPRVQPRRTDGTGRGGSAQPNSQRRRAGRAEYNQCSTSSLKKELVNTRPAAVDSHRAVEDFHGLPAFGDSAVWARRSGVQQAMSAWKRPCVPVGLIMATSARPVLWIFV